MIARNGYKFVPFAPLLCDFSVLPIKKWTLNLCLLVSGLALGLVLVDKRQPKWWCGNYEPKPQEALQALLSLSWKAFAIMRRGWTSLFDDERLYGERFPASIQHPASTTSRTGNIICKAQQDPLFHNYQEFQDSKSRTIDKAQVGCSWSWPSSPENHLGPSRPSQATTADYYHMSKPRQSQQNFPAKSSPNCWPPELLASKLLF